MRSAASSSTSCIVWSKRNVRSEGSSAAISFNSDEVCCFLATAECGKKTVSVNKLHMTKNRKNVLNLSIDWTNMNSYVWNVLKDACFKDTLINSNTKAI